MKPPAMARALLLAVAGEGWYETVAGDLEEEFLLVCESRSRFAGKRWYLKQVVRSVTPLLLLRMRSAEVQRTAIAALLSVALPLVLLDRLWSFVYSQIPLKDGFLRAPHFLALNVLAVSVGSAISGSRLKSRPAAISMALAATAASGFALWVSAAAGPVLYTAIILAVAPASSLLSFRLRRRA